MSLELSDDAVKGFEAEVHHVFQPEVEDIRSRLRVKNAKGLKVVQFPVLGRTVSSERTNFHTSIPVGNASHDPVTVTVKNWTASEYTDVFLNNQVNYDERQELAKSITMALKRRMLQLVINALVDATITNTVAKNVSGTNDNLSRKMLKESMRLISKVGATKADRTFMAHTNGIAYLTDDSRISSLDYNTNTTIVSGEIGTLFGFKFLEVPDMSDEGGLPLSTNDRTNFAFQKMAVGLAVNMEPKVEIWYDGDKGAHKVTGFLSANAVVIDVTGTAEITTDESVV
jgi:hypothetical protein